VKRPRLDASEGAQSLDFRSTTALSAARTSAASIIDSG